MNNANDRSADEKALHDLFQEIKDGWNQGDGRAFAASFTEDADYIVVNGTYLKGRQAIAAAHQQLFETLFRGSRLQGFIKNIRFLSDDIASLHLHGRPQVPGQAVPAPEQYSIQTLKGRCIRMYLWSLVSVMNSKPQPPPQPDGLSVSIPLALATVIFLVLISFGIGAMVSWVIVARQRHATMSSATLSYPPAALPSNIPDDPVQSHIRKAFEHGVNYQRSNPLILSSTQPAYQGPQSVKQNTSPPPIVPPLRKEDPLNNKRWLGLAEECVDLFNELDDLSIKVDAPRKEMIRHVKLRLQEILVRSGIEVISSDTIYDIRRHQIEPPALDAASETSIVEIISPGFAAGRLVLRPARVRVATTSSGNATEDESW